MMIAFNEVTIEHHAIALLRELGYSYAFGPDGNLPDLQGWMRSQQRQGMHR